MTITPQQFEDRLVIIRARLVEQGWKVADLTERVFETIYDREAEEAGRLVDRDDEIDQADIEIERLAVDLLTEAVRTECPIEPGPIRSLLTAVKVNNELERIADEACAIASLVISLGERTSPFPKTTRVMTNSIVAAVRETVRSFDEINAERSRVVLASEGNTVNFYDLISRDAELRVADGRMGVDTAFDLHAIINHAVRMGDHCTNIAEQVIYQATGTIVRHTTSGWVDQHLPGLARETNSSGETD